MLQNITAEDEHLGILGPRIMCEVGDTVRVVFRNNLAMPSQIVPRGLQYPASDVTLAIPPGGTHTYVYVLCAMLTAVGGWWFASGALSLSHDRPNSWQVPVRSGPGPDDPSSIGWLYGAELAVRGSAHAPLTAPNAHLVLTSRPWPRRDWIAVVACWARSLSRVRATRTPMGTRRCGLVQLVQLVLTWYLSTLNLSLSLSLSLSLLCCSSPNDIDRQFSVVFEVNDENQQPYISRNYATFLVKDGRPEGPMVEDSNRKHTINGYSYGNLNGLVAYRYETVRWYVYAVGQTIDIHLVHWHANTELFGTSLLLAAVQCEAFGFVVVLL